MVLERSASVHRNDSANLELGVNQYEVAASLTVLHKSCPFKRTDYLPRCERRELRHSSSRNCNSSLKGTPLFRDWLAVGGQTLDVKRNGLSSIALSLL